MLYFKSVFARHTVVHDAKPGEAVELSPLRLRFGLTLVFYAAKAGDVHFTLKQHLDPRRPANPGLWKIDFARPTRGGLDDYKCEMHGLPPFLFLSPEKYWE